MNTAEYMARELTRLRAENERLKELADAADDVAENLNGCRVGRAQADALRVLETILCEIGVRTGPGYRHELSDWRASRAALSTDKEASDE